MLLDIQTMLLNNIENFEYLMRIKKIKETISTINNNPKIETKELLSVCKKLNVDYALLKDFLKRFNETSLKNAEICFLLHNFYMLIDKQIPPELEYNFLFIENYDSLEELETSFQEKNMRHPMMLKLENKSLTISYISQKLCDYINYKKSELLGQDLHILLPGSFAREHSIMIKRFVLLEEKTLLNKQTFILTKDQYYFPVKVSFVVLPHIKENTIIIDFQPIEQTEVNRSVFFFILNNNLDLVTFNKQYEEKFGLTFEMFDKMKISVLNLYGINENSILSEFDPWMQDIFRENIEKLENMIEVLKSFDLKTALNNLIVDPKRIPAYQKSLKIKTIHARNNSTIQYLQKLESLILEKEFNQDWMKRVLLFEQQSSLTSNAAKLLIHKNKKNDNNYDSIKIEINLRNVGSQPYFLIKISTREIPNIVQKFILSANNNSAHRRGSRFLGYDDFRKDTAEKLNKYQTLNNSTETLESFNSSMHGLIAKKNFESRNYTFDDTQSVFNYEKSQKFSNRKYNQRIVETLKRNKKNEKFLFFCLVACLMVLALLPIFNLFFTNETLNTSLNMFKINYNAMALKSSVVYNAAAVVSACLKTAGAEFNSISGFVYSVTEYQRKLGLRAIEIQVYSYRMNKYLSEAMSTADVDKVREILDTYQNYTLLYKNWKVFNRNSTFIDEIGYYNYYMNYMTAAGLWNKCEYKNFANLKNVPKNSTANYGETVVYYIINNMMNKFFTSFESLTKLTNSVMLSFHQTSQIKLIAFNVSMILICVANSISFLFTILQYKSKIISNLKYLFESRPQDCIFEKYISNYKSVLLCLDNQNGHNYEINKKDIAEENISIKAKPEVKKTKDKQIIVQKNNKKEEQQKEINYDYRINLIKFSVVSMILINLVFIFITSLNIIFIIINYSELVFASHINMSFLDRIPNITYLILYYKLSIILGDANYISVPQSDYETRDDIYHYFDIPQNVMQDSLFSTLDKSEFSYIVYLSLMQKENIAKFISGPYEHILPNLRSLERIINSDEEYCFFVAEYNLYYFVNKPPDPNFKNNFASMSTTVSECRRIGYGVNLKGFNSAIENHLSSMTSLYTDFYKSKGKNIPATNWLSDANFLSAQLNSEYTLKKLHNVVLYFMAIDMQNTYDKIKLNEIIFSILQIVISLFFIFYFIFGVILKMQKYNYELNQAVKKFKTANDYKINTN